MTRKQRNSRAGFNEADFINKLADELDAQAHWTKNNIDNVNVLVGTAQLHSMTVLMQIATALRCALMRMETRNKE